MSINLTNVSYVYMPHTPYETTALEDINVDIKDGELFAIIGHTGSGKSTLVQMLNGLIKPDKGSITVDGEDIAGKKYNLKNLRFKVGLVFQYPEHQLFEETVFKDVAYGPGNMNMLEEEINKRVISAIKTVGLDESVLSKSPFELSGGQKRRVAIAGIIAMEPKYIVFDEPSAGLDPEGRESMLNMLRMLNKERGMTVVIVSHSMEEVAKIADRVLVMNKGKAVICEEPKKVFIRTSELEGMGLDVPKVTRLMRILKDRGFKVRNDVVTVEEAKNEILKYLSMFK